jgi:hypothetical protein
MRDMYRRFSVAEGIFSRLSSIVRILLANSEASKFRLAFHFFEGTEAWKKLGGNLGFIVVK